MCRGGPQREALDALRTPLCADLDAGRAPDLLGIGLEEDAVELLPKAIRNPLFECLLWFVLNNIQALQSRRDLPSRNYPHFVDARFLQW